MELEALPTSSRSDQQTLELECWAPGYLAYPPLRFMGSKHRLLPWMRSVLADLEFDTAIDAFSGSGCVSYLLKTMDKVVWSNDFLCFTCDFTKATVENSVEHLESQDLELLLSPAPYRKRFIESNFRGIFFTDEDNAFLDQVWANLHALSPHKRALALASLYRACLKRQPRGVFTVSGIGRYDDGRRDLQLTLSEHFVESVPLFNRLVFDNGRRHRTTCSDLFAWETRGRPGLSRSAVRATRRRQLLHQAVPLP